MPHGRQSLAHPRNQILCPTEVLTTPPAVDRDRDAEGSSVRRSSKTHESPELHDIQHGFHRRSVEECGHVHGAA
jgi:hypothetical protein